MSTASPLEMLAQTCQNIGSDKNKQSSNALSIAASNLVPTSAQNTTAQNSLKRNHDRVSSKSPTSTGGKQVLEKREKLSDEQTSHKVVVRKTYSPPVDVLSTKYGTSSNALAELAKFSSNLVLSHNQKSPPLSQIPQNSPKRVQNHTGKSKSGRLSNNRSSVNGSPNSVSPGAQLNLLQLQQTIPDPLSTAPMTNIVNFIEHISKTDDTQSVLYQMLLREYCDSFNKTTHQPKRETSSTVIAKFCMYCGKRFDNQGSLLLHVYTHFVNEDETPTQSEPPQSQTLPNENTGNATAHPEMDNMLASIWTKLFMSEEYQQLLKQNTNNGSDNTSSEFMNYFWPMMAQNVNLLCDKISPWPMEKSL